MVPAPWATMVAVLWVAEAATAVQAPWEVMVRRAVLLTAAEIMALAVAITTRRAVPGLWGKADGATVPKAVLLLTVPAQWEAITTATRAAIMARRLRAAATAITMINTNPIIKINKKPAVKAAGFLFIFQALNILIGITG